MKSNEYFYRKITPRFHVRMEQFLGTAEQAFIAGKASDIDQAFWNLWGKGSNRTTIAQWVNALRGQYKAQGKKRQYAILLDNGNYSALGVLCDLLEPTGWKWDDATYQWHDGYLFIPSAEFLHRHGISHQLAMEVDWLNEDCNRSLRQIADYLERKYLHNRPACQLIRRRLSRV